MIAVLGIQFSTQQSIVLSSSSSTWLLKKLTSRFVAFQDLSGQYARNTPGDDKRFIDDFGNLQSIVTSAANQDSGMLETNLHDERYLPFEGAGVISTWQLQLPSDPSQNEPCQFDYKTIIDVILHIRYTATDGQNDLRNAALEHLQSVIKTGDAKGNTRLFSIRHEFPSEWAKFIAVKLQAPIKSAELTLNLREEHYPFWSQGGLNKVIKGIVIAKSKKDTIRITEKADLTGEQIALKDASLPGLFMGNLEKLIPARPVTPEDSPLKLSFNDNTMEDLWLAITGG